MTIHIKATGFDLTPALHKEVEDIMSGLAKFVQRWDEEGSVLLRVEIAKTTKHHHKGNVFYAEANMDIPKKVLRVEETNTDMHTALNMLKDRLKNEIVRYKEKMTNHKNPSQQ
ncbi:MAG: ribosome-associated translation inhibitor RaiA [bacterium]|nr:ribosome-associated translation inhibitor RaiA [bacterium]